MFCTNCGTTIEANVRFCPQCGTAVAGINTSPGMTAEKKLTRPIGGQWIAGVCLGFSRYFGIDVTLVRLLWLATIILAGTGILAYIICWFVIPREYSA